MDTEGYAIQNLADPKTNPFIICSQDLFNIASNPLGSGAFDGVPTIPSFLSWHFEGCEERLDSAIGSIVMESITSV